MRNKRTALANKLDDLKALNKSQKNVQPMRNGKEFEKEFNFKLVMYKNLFDEYQHRKQTIKSMKSEADTLRAARRHEPDVSSDRLVVLEAKIGKIYELLPEDFKFPETDEKAKQYQQLNYVDIDDQEEDYIEQVSDRIYEKLIREDARLITNDQYKSYESPASNYYSYDANSALRSKQKKKIVPKKLSSPKQSERNHNYSGIYEHSKDSEKYNYGKAPKLTESKTTALKGSNITSTTISKKSKDKTPGLITKSAKSRPITDYSAQYSSNNK